MLKQLKKLHLNYLMDKLLKVMNDALRIGRKITKCAGILIINHIRVSLYLSYKVVPKDNIVIMWA